MGSKKQDTQPEIKQMPLEPWQQTQNELYQKYMPAYTESQWGQYQDVFEPMSRSLGGILGDELKNPWTMNEEIFNNAWQQAREKGVSEYAPAYQQGSERAAGRGMLNQGPTEKYFQGLDISKAKSIEDMSIDMAIMRYQEEKAAKQQSISNAASYLGYQPTFDITGQIPQSYTTAGSSGSGGTGTMLGGLGGAAAGAATAAMLGLGAGTGGVGALPWILGGAGVGGTLGGGIGSLF